jgi:hypothetical protein
MSAIWSSINRVDTEHGAANTGVFVAAGCGVGTPAVAELQRAFVEVFLELDPLGVGGWSIFLGGSHRPPVGEMGLVVAHDVFVEHRNVAAGGFQVEVAQEGGADVDGQPVVDQVGGEQPSEVVRGEGEIFEPGIVLSEVSAYSAEHFTDRAGGHDFVALADAALEQERLRAAGGAFVFVVAGSPTAHSSTRLTML